MDITKTTQYTIVRDNICPSPIICTNNTLPYVGAFRKHKTFSYSVQKYVNCMVRTDGVESMWEALKRVHNSVYHNWDVKYCCLYVNKFTSFLNGGNCEWDRRNRLSSLFKRLVGKTITYRLLVV